MSAINEYQENSCVRFVEWNGESHYVTIYKDVGCWSYVGRQGGEQHLSLGEGCVYVCIILIILFFLVYLFIVLFVVNLSRNFVQVLSFLRCRTKFFLFFLERTYINSIMCFNHCLVTIYTKDSITVDAVIHYILISVYVIIERSGDTWAGTRDWILPWAFTTRSGWVCRDQYWKYGGEELSELL